MLLAGDEFLRTPARQQQRLVPGQRDRAGSTGGWPEQNADFLRFVRELIALRKRHPALRRRDVLPRRRPRRRPDAGRHLARRRAGPARFLARAAARWPSPWTAGRPAASRTAISTWPATPGRSRSTSAFRARPRAGRGGVRSTPTCRRPATLSSWTTARASRTAANTPWRRARCWCLFPNNSRAA